jgi:hypothetical protein
MASPLHSSAAVIQGPSCACPIGNTSVFTRNDEFVTSRVTSAVDGNLCKVTPPTICVFQNPNEISGVNFVGRLHMLQELLVVDKARDRILIGIAVDAAMLQPAMAAAPSTMAAMIQAPSLTANV